MEEGSEHLGLLPLTYYSFLHYKTREGLLVESVGQCEAFVEGWKVVQQAVGKANQSRRFVTVAGYE